LQERQGLMVACPEEIAYHLGWITAEDVSRIANPMKMNDYGTYLLRMLDQEAQAR
jgi:glucose-1-phosphate thymidylyltransferase